MRWILLGPPGSGKGTQAKKLADNHHVAHLSTGDILRGEVSGGTELGKQAKSYMDAGDMVPDQLIVDMIRRRLEPMGHKTGFILDGFPRNTAQADALAQMLSELNLSLDRVVLVDVSDKEIAKRLAGRARLERRADDSDQVIAHRLEVYRKQTAPLIEYYECRGLLARVNGEQSIDAVCGEMETLATARAVSRNG